MQKDRTGGPAFPSQEIVPHEDGNERLRQHLGMTMRDLFAAAALQGVARDYGVTAEDRARQCYEYADALIAQREKP